MEGLNIKAAAATLDSLNRITMHNCHFFNLQKQAQIHSREGEESETQQSRPVSRVDYKSLEKNAITTFLVTMSHIL